MIWTNGHGKDTYIENKQNIYTAAAYVHIKLLFTDTCNYHLTQYYALEAQRL